MAMTERSRRLLTVILAVLAVICLGAIVGRLAAFIPAGGVILAALLVATAMLAVVGRRFAWAKPWMRALSGLVFRNTNLAIFVASILILASLHATFLWRERVATERATVETAQRAAIAKAQAEAEAQRAKEQQERKLNEEFKQQKDRLFSDLEVAGNLISEKKMAAATVALVALSASVTSYGSSGVAETLEYRTLARGLNSTKRRLESLIDEKKSEIETHCDEAERLTSKKRLDEAEKNLAQIEQELAPLEGLDEMRFPPSLRDLRESVRTRTVALRSRIAERRDEHDLGERIALGGFAYVVQEIDQKDAVGNWLTRETAGEGATFLIVRYTMENLGSESETVIADDFELQDSGGRSYRPSSEANTALAMSGGSKDLFASELHPGVKRKMTTAFEVPKAMLKGGFTIIIPEKGLFGTGRAKIGPLVFQ